MDAERVGAQRRSSLAKFSSTPCFRLQLPKKVIKPSSHQRLRAGCTPNSGSLGGEIMIALSRPCPIPITGIQFESLLLEFLRRESPALQGVLGPRETRRRELCSCHSFNSMEYRTGTKGTLGAQKRESKSSIRRLRMSKKFSKLPLPDFWMRVGGGHCVEP